MGHKELFQPPDLVQRPTDSPLGHTHRCGNLGDAGKGPPLPVAGGHVQVQANDKGRWCNMSIFEVVSRDVSPSFLRQRLDAVLRRAVDPAAQSYAPHIGALGSDLIIAK